MKIYILCPNIGVTGGIELAHQLCDAINTYSDIKAYMWYILPEDAAKGILVSDCQTHEAYQKYNTPHATSLDDIDQKNNVVVIPETNTGWHTFLHNAIKVVWWMSVDNYIASSGEENIDDLTNSIDLHLFQSYYAKSYVEKKIPNCKGLFLSDYINDIYGKTVLTAEIRKDMVLYNPRKGYSNLKPIIEYSNWAIWCPLMNLSREKVNMLMQVAKVYIDFGSHPGKDRLPREAAINGMCVVTNRSGAAAFYEDIPILDCYKLDISSPLDQEMIIKIDNLLHDICDNFSKHQKNFEKYREFIQEGKDIFKKDVLHFLNEVEKRASENGE